ncbi:MAG: MBL fold metallo-hydrolase, partial [Candidatus Kariarchaeaceae archaeon]
MFELQIIQAKYGDCFLVKMGEAQELYHLLIDGGPSKIYDTNLRKELMKIQSEGGNLNLVVSSHVDSDHIRGLVDLTTELVDQRARRQSELIEIKDIWHNAFSQTIGRGSDLEPRIRFLHSSAGIVAQNLPFLNLVIQGISQGHKLMRKANLLDIPINS